MMLSLIAEAIMITTGFSTRGMWRLDFVDSKFRRHAIYICVRYTSFRAGTKHSCRKCMPSKDSLFCTMLSLGVVKSFRCVENHSKDFIDFPRLRIVKLLMARRWPMPWVSPDFVLWRRGDFWGLAGFTSRRGFTGHGFLVEPNNSESFSCEADKEAAKEIDLAEEALYT